jgi:hypothetical protein
MRWLLLLPLGVVSVSVLGAGCDWPSTASATSGTTVVPEAGAQCPQTTTCQECASCALQGPCESDWAACMADPDCSSIDGCAGACAGNAACIQACEANNPNGMAAYQAAWSCTYCTQCPSICTGLCTAC